MRIVSHLPKMAVEVGEIAAVAAPEGVLRRLADGRTGPAGAFDYRIDVGLRVAIPGQRDAPERLGHAFAGYIGVLCEFLRRKNRNRASTGLKEADAFSSPGFALK